MKDIEVRLISLQSNSDAATILKAAEETNKVLREEHLITIPMFQAIPTIAEVFIKTLLQKAAAEAASSGNTTMINVFDLFEIGFDVDNDEESEKGGNIVPAFRPLAAAKMDGKSDTNMSGE